MSREKRECIILAAGLSSRMGTWKLMMPWGAGVILDSALSNALAFCDRVVLVTGHRGDELAAYYQDESAIEIVHNPEYKDGMFSSIQCGVAAITAQHFFLALGDMPEVDPSVYRTLWSLRDRHTCLIPGYDRGKGHPVLLPQKAITLITQTSAQGTLKEIVNQMVSRVIPVKEQGIHWDVDTPEQYNQIMQWSHQH